MSHILGCEHSKGQDDFPSRAGFSDASHRMVLTRRSALGVLLGAAAAAVLFERPLPALADPSASQGTLNKLSDAQARYDAVKKQLDDIAERCRKLAVEQDRTLSDIESVQTQIDSTKQQIEEKELELKEKQTALASRVSASYKTHGNDALALLLSSTSFEELVSNAYYVDSMNEHDHDAIVEVQKIQRELDQEKAQLDRRKSELVRLKELQAKQLDAYQTEKARTQPLLDSAGAEVQQLMAQRDAELLAAMQAAAEKRREDEEARRHSTPSDSGGDDAPPIAGLSGGQSRVINACRKTPCPGPDRCAAWVSHVFLRAGLGSVGGDACDMYNSWCRSSNKDTLRAGMIVAVSEYGPAGSPGGRYGHVAIYIGGNQVMESIGRINTQPLSSWIAYYGGTVTPRWGWANNVDLSKVN